ncbi:fibronectin type III domain-containing protein, partial [Aduncisulcus paluster]
MGEGSDFYAYKWNTVLYTNDIDGDISGVENQEALFKIYDIPGSGHPAGYTYAWIMNDEDYLYAVLDFTPDNTFDGDKDYASLYIDTPSGVKAFTVSESQKEWGAP